MQKWIWDIFSCGSFTIGREGKSREQFLHDAEAALQISACNSQHPARLHRALSWCAEAYLLCLLYSLCLRLALKASFAVMYRNGALALLSSSLKCAAEEEIFTINPAPQKFLSFLIILKSATSLPLAVPRSYRSGAVTDMRSQLTRML